MRTSIVLVFACCIALVVGYSTSGNKILDPSGKPILLRGIARPSLEWNTAGESLSLADYQLMKNWGANCVRLSLNQCFWLSGMAGYSSSYQATVDQQVQWIKSLGMAVILDLHWSNKGNSGNGCGQQRMADTISLTFWTQVATKYKNDKDVIFELYNEPHDVSWSVWKNGGDTGDGYNTPGFQAIYNTIRNANAPNLCIIGGLNWAYDLSGVSANLISGYNIAYNTHPYNTPDRQPSNWITAFGYLAANYPIIATEFGATDCSTSYVNSFLTFADQNCISYTGWGWYPGGCSFPSLVVDWKGTASTPGLLVKQSLTSGPKVPTCGGAAVTATTTTVKATTSTTAAATTTTGKVTTSTTTTTGGTTSSIPVYVDAVLTPFADWSWATVRNAADSSKHQAGLTSYSFQPSGYGSVYFNYRQGIDPSVHQSIQFYVNTGNGGQVWNFNMIRYDGTNSNKIGPDNRVATYCSSNPLPANTWVQCTVPLSSFPSGKYDGFWFIDQSGSSQSTVYLDSISIVAK